ncbi:hypothetical protein [Fusobacterium gonidiaformans]|uniref:hypothetical protein n=1 Tax=Fusobacterium gonidiaformans TaxID=849 RepID=UPI00307D3D8B
MDKKQVEDLQSLLQEQNYTIIYVDFANPKNVIVSHSINDFSSIDLEHFAKFYVFNDNFMRVYSRKGPKHFDFYEIQKEDFDPGYDEKVFFVDYSQYKKLHMRVGKIDGKSAMQYLYFE